jgi:cytochrome c
MRRRWIAFAVGLSLAGSAEAVLDNAAGEAMMKSNGCAGCHEVDKKLIGPSYVEVAAKYRGDKDAVAKLRAKVKKGGVHVWGEAAMPPNVLASDADINALVDWILSLKQ